MMRKINAKIAHTNTIFTEFREFVYNILPKITAFTTYKKVIHQMCI